MPALYPPELTERHVGDAQQQLDGWVGGATPPSQPIAVVDPDPAWPAQFAAESARVEELLGDVVVRIEHVGSTSVAGLPAKPIIDIDLQVADSAAEDAYVPALERAGYRLVLREPWWNGHRMLLGPGGRSHLHVFPVGAPEPLRHLLFRDWLRAHPGDLALYAAVKKDLARATAENPGDYNLAKNAVIDDIYTRIFAVPPQSHPAWPTPGSGARTPGRTLETARLTLRPYAPDDADAVLDLYSRWEVQRFIGRVPRVMADRAEALERIERWASHDDHDGGVRGIWAVVPRDETAPVGTLLLKGIPTSAGHQPLGTSGDADDTEIGWHFHPRSWGKGYATEAARVVLARALASGIERVVAVTHRDNQASQAVCRRLGMVHQGRTDRYYDTSCELFVIEG